MKQMFLKDATDSLKKMEDIKKQLRQKLNTCALTKFKSGTECSDFYSVFFCNNLPKDIEFTAKDWFTLYREIIEQKTFYTNLINYMAMWKPVDYTMLFRGLRTQIDTELADMHKDRILYVAEMSTNMNALYTQFETIKLILSKQLIQPDLMMFAKNTVMILDQYRMELADIHNKELHDAEEKNADGLRRFVRPDVVISESCQQLLDAIESTAAYLEDLNADTAVDEGIVSKAKDKANQVLVGTRKVEDYCDRTLFKAFDTWRGHKERKNHEEMMGETLKISSMIKKALGIFLTFKIFGPIGAILSAIVAFAVDSRTKKTDRIKILNDVKDELEIVDEKIQIAEKKGDDKAKIEMMRIRQRLKREYEKLSRGYIYKDPNRY